MPCDIIVIFIIEIKGSLFLFYQKGISTFNYFHRIKVIIHYILGQKSIISTHPICLFSLTHPSPAYPNHLNSKSLHYILVFLSLKWMVIDLGHNMM